jgi:membrane protein YqaA with SNARE-associated domain
MDVNSFVAEHGIHLATFVVCLVSAFIPIINAELFLIGFSSLITPAEVPAVIILATCGQMLAKSTLYLAGRGVIKLPKRKRLGAKLKKIQAKLGKHKGKTAAFLFVSALTGVPMFYLVSIVSGSLKLNFPFYFFFGASGRLLRFAIVIIFPQLIKELFFS